MKASIYIDMLTDGFRSNDWDFELESCLKQLAGDVRGIVVGGNISSVQIPIKDSLGKTAGFLTIDFVKGK
jgi:hypothetical protein